MSANAQRAGASNLQYLSLSNCVHTAELPARRILLRPRSGEVFFSCTDAQVVTAC